MSYHNKYFSCLTQKNYMINKIITSNNGHFNRKGGKLVYFCGNRVRFALTE